MNNLLAVSLKHVFAVGLCCVLLFGCSSVYYEVPAYSVNADNQALLQFYKGRYNIDVGRFTVKPAFQRALSCHIQNDLNLQTIDLANYVRSALVKELQTANLYNRESAIKIEGVLDSYDMERVPNGRWRLQLTAFTSGQRVTVDIYHPFQTVKWSASRGCEQAAAALPKAVERLLLRLLNHPSFKSMLRFANEPQINN